MRGEVMGGVMMGGWVKGAGGVSGEGEGCRTKWVRVRAGFLSYNPKQAGSCSQCTACSPSPPWQALLLQHGSTQREPPDREKQNGEGQAIMTMQV